MNSRRLWWCSLDAGSARYPKWRQILGCDEVPLVAPGSTYADLGPEKGVEVYLLDTKALTRDQRERLVNWICAAFLESHEEVERELDRVGFPIRATDAYVTFDMRAFL
jgi:hypothetical protein